MDEIFNGKGKYYPGLIPLVYAYLDYIRCIPMQCYAMSCHVLTSQLVPCCPSCHVLSYLVKSCSILSCHVMYCSVLSCPDSWLSNSRHRSHTMQNLMLQARPTLECGTSNKSHVLILNTSTSFVTDVTPKPSRESTSTSNSYQGTCSSLPPASTHIHANTHTHTHTHTHTRTHTHAHTYTHTHTHTHIYTHTHTHPHTHTHSHTWTCMTLRTPFLMHFAIALLERYTSGRVTSKISFCPSRFKNLSSLILLFRLLQTLL